MRVSVPETNQWVEENMDLTHPITNNTSPVTTQAEVKRASSGRSGKAAGIITYPSKGRLPKKAKAQNITKPSCGGERSVEWERR